MTQEKKLNAGQKAAAEQVFSFLLSNDKEMCISGPGGSGKTFLMGDLIDRVIPEFQAAAEIMGNPNTIDTVEMTATTNKAAEVLGNATNRPTKTVHSAFGLVVKSDYSTGTMKLVRGRGWVPKQNTLVFVDEGYCADSQLRNQVIDSCVGSKVIWVGDHCQLGPVKEQISPIHTSGLRTAYLTESHRNKDQPALMAICAQLRETVETGVFNPIKEVPGVIDFVDDDQFAAEMRQVFKEADPDVKHKIVAYDNSRVIQYCQFLRAVRNLPEYFTAGEILVNNTAVIRGKERISVEEEVEVIRIDDFITDTQVSDDASFQVRRADIKTKFNGMMYDVEIPVDMDHFSKLRNWYKNQKKWSEYFKMNEQYPDLRMREASTTHKAQGSTHHTVYIDLGNLSTCNQPLTVARLLYVAFSRATTRVVCYGDLVSKYGGTIRA